MRDSESFLKFICDLYPPPEKININFSNEDINKFESALGTELPYDYYEFLKVYGYGSFSDYFYINNPFIENDTENFISENNQRKEDYNFLERNAYEKINGKLTFADCIFIDGKTVVTAGNPELVGYMRMEKTDVYTRSKIIKFGDHFPYEFYLEKNYGLIFIAYTDDEDFFYRYSGGRGSIVIYSSDYYEFDMSFTEFVYGYLTKKIKLPMSNDETEWEFISY